MLENKSLLITAGPTWEAIDPVRGITNHSSGKMGYALASVAAELGARVSLISGPVCLAPPKHIDTTEVQSAQQMYDAVHQAITRLEVDVFIGVAAVADYRPIAAKAQKIKKSADQITITLVKNPDIVASVAKLKKGRPFTVGFAAETEQLEHHAREKLKAKKLDMIIANDVSEPGIGFGAAQNRATMFTKNQQLDLGKHDKTALAKIILFQISNHLKQ